MFQSIKHTYILFIICSLLTACNQTKYVPEGKFLIKKNKVSISGDDLTYDMVNPIIRQQPNYKTFGFKMKLWAYNRIDSTVVAEKRLKLNYKLRKTNEHKILRQQHVNNKRIAKARKKGRELYTEKIIYLKDTVNVKLFLREWFKYKLGEKPVVFDSLIFNKSKEQLNVFLKNKGFFRGSVTAEVVELRRRKVKVRYKIESGKRFIIDSVYMVFSNPIIKPNYENYVLKTEGGNLVGQPFDKDLLGEYRDNVAKYMRDNAFYGFSNSNISYVADTSFTDMTVHLGVVFSDRMLQSVSKRDSLIAVKHKVMFIKNVYFHIADTSYFKGNFKKTLQDMGLTLLDDQYFVRTIDTFQYAERKVSHSDELDMKRIATFLYNGELKIDPDVIELQNYLEKENYYKEYYLERSYKRLIQLDLFQVIKPVIVEVPGTKYLDIHYYLVPSQKQSLGFEPRATNSNGFLGVSASINYTNKNLFGGAEKMVFSVGGGFESQPPVFDQSIDGQPIQKPGRSFNTFEIGPSLKFDIPGLFPTKVTALSKRQRPRTIMSVAYNYQDRSDFTRHILQLNYLWKFYVDKTQIFQIGLPGLSVIKFVDIKNSPAFEQVLTNLNDLFLRNAYSNQFIWQDLRFTFEYNNKEDENKKRANFLFNSSFDPAGNLLSLFKNRQDTLSNGQYSIFSVAYSQFARLDNEMIYSYPMSNKKSVHARLQAGIGIPYGNTKTSLPYDYAFFAGGSNDNRGWRARALGPGSYKYYLDTNRTATQISDIRLGASSEFRFSMSDVLKGAIFIDAGNTWTYNLDKNRLGSQFSNNWFREIAVSSGIGFRMDFDFFILRLDLGIPITNPSMPIGERWIFNRERPNYISEGINTFGLDKYQRYLPKPFTPVFHFGIGFPF